ncbi:MAG: DUF6350 family protein [Candidatus Nanopelagicales bacterium]
MANVTGVTEVVDASSSPRGRTRLRRSSGPAAPWPVLLAGPIAAIGGTAVTWVLFGIPPLLLWFTSTNTGAVADSVMGVAATVWLGAQGVPMVVDGVTITLVPWGLGALILLVLFAAGRWAARVAVIERRSTALGLAAVAAVTYALLAVGASALLDQSDQAPGRVLLTTFVVGGIGVGLGVLSYGGHLRTWLTHVAAPVRHVCAAGIVGFMVWVGAGAALVGIALLADSATLLDVGSGIDVAALIAAIVLAIGYLPVAVGWAISYGIGAGFVPVGGVTVGPFSTEVVPALPPLPLFSALPVSPPAGSAMLPVVGIIAGVLGAAVLRRRGLSGRSLLAAALGAVCVSALLLTIVLVASSGALGSNQLDAIGPNIIPAVGVACGLWAVGYLIVVLPTVWRGLAHEHVTEQE